MLEKTLIWELMEKMQGDIAAELRVMLGEGPYDPKMFTDEEHKRRVVAMQLCAEQGTDARTRHDAWVKMHTDGGWVYGDKFDPATKSHPNLKPWDDLPASTRSKAEVFAIVARTAKTLELEFEELFA